MVQEIWRWTGSKHDSGGRCITKAACKASGFRFTTERIASRFAVDGFVKNLPDGRVLVVVEGEAKELDRFLAEVQRRNGREYPHHCRRAGGAEQGNSRVLECGIEWVLK